MKQSPLTTVLEQLRHSFAAQAAHDLSDGELLRQYLADAEQAAFTVLVQRHGPMVLTLCKRILGDFHAAEDAFQATFMVLARRAGALKRRKPLGGWLYGVARRIALKSRARYAARLDRERQAKPMQGPDLLDELTWQELRAILDEEIGRLPEKYQMPIVLCYLQGKSHDQAARELGCPKNSITSRLGRAKELLRHQLIRRGVSLSVQALALALSEKATAAPLGALLAIKTVKAACSVAAGKAAIGGVSATAVALADEAIAVMVRIKAFAVLMVLALGTALSGAVVAAIAGLAGSGPPAKAEKAQPPQAKIVASGPAKKDVSPVDLDGDPLPVGAVARLGAKRFRFEPNLDGRNLAYASNAEMLAASTNEGIVLWDTVTGKELRRFPGYVAGAALDFSPNGKTLAINQGDVSLIEITTGKQLFKVGSRGGAIAPISGLILFSPDGRTLAVFFQKSERELGLIRILDAVTGEEKLRLQENLPPQDAVDTVFALAFSPDGKALAAGKLRSVRVYQTATGKITQSFDQKRSIHSVAYAPDGRTLAWSSNEKIVLIETATGNERARIELDESVGSFLAFTHDSRFLLAGTQLVDAFNGKKRMDLGGEPRKFGLAVLSRDGKSVATLGSGLQASRIRLWDAISGSEKFTELQGHDTSIRGVAFSPDGKKVTTAGDGYGHYLWDSATSWTGAIPALRPRNSESVNLWDPVTGKNLLRLEGNNGKVTAFAPYGKRLAAVDSESKDTALAWDAAAGNAVFRVSDKAAKKTVVSLAFVGDGLRTKVTRHLNGAVSATTFMNYTFLHIWDSNSGKRIEEFELNNLYPCCLTVAAHGQTAAIGGQRIEEEDGFLGLLDIKAGGKFKIFAEQKHPVVSLAFSPDCKLLATGSADNSLRIWDVAMTREVLKLVGHEHAAAAVVFSPDGRVLASADGVAVNPRITRSELPPKSDKIDPKATLRIHFWDVATGKEIRHFEGMGANVTSLAFSPDGTRLVSGLGDGTALVWDVAGVRPVSK